MRADVVQPGECSVECRRETEGAGDDGSEDTGEQGGTWRVGGSRSWLEISDRRPFCTSARVLSRCFLFEQHVEEGGVKRVTTGDSVFGSSNPLRGSPWLEKGAARVRTLKAGRRTDSGWGGGSVSLCPYSGGRRRRGWMGRARGSARAREYRRMAAGSGQRAAGSVVAREGPGPDGTGFAWLRRARSFVSRLSGSVVHVPSEPGKFSLSPGASVH